MHIGEALAAAPRAQPAMELMATGPSTLVSELGMCVLAAGFLSALFERLRIPTIAALLGAGVILGPSAGLATDGFGHMAQPRIVVLGFHRVGFALLQDISRQHPDSLRDVMVVDINVHTHDAIREFGARVVYGDAGNPETLRHAHVDTCGLVISSVPDELLKRTSNEAIVGAVRAVSPNVPIFACASRADRVAQLYAAGATYAYIPAVETANGVLSAAAAALANKLPAFRATREAAGGPLTDRKELGGMSV